MAFPMTWITLLGLSLLFTGGFVLWVYGAQKPTKPVATSGPEAEATRSFHEHLVSWFFLYGVVAVAIGIGCLLYSATRLL